MSPEDRQHEEKEPRDDEAMTPDDLAGGFDRAQPDPAADPDADAAAGPEPLEVTVDADDAGEPARDVEPNVDDRSADPLPLEAPESGPLEVENAPACPQCGAPLPVTDVGLGLCLRCGEREDVPAAAGDAGPVTSKPPEPDAPALVRPMPADPWGVLVIGIAAFIAIAAAYLVGDLAMFPTVSPLEEGQAAPLIKPAIRFEGVVRLLVLLGLWTTGGVGALLAGTWLLGRPLGDISHAAARVFAICSVSRLATFLNLPGATVEAVLEVVIQLVAIFLLSMAAFRMKPRDAGTLLAIAVVALLALAVGARLVTWAT
jgi:hypothetical protein